MEPVIPYDNRYNLAACLSRIESVSSVMCFDTAIELWIKLRLVHVNDILVFGDYLLCKVQAVHYLAVLRQTFQNWKDAKMLFPNPLLIVNVSVVARREIIQAYLS